MSQRSPKFFLREKVISEIINTTSLVKTWKKKTFTDMRNMFLPDPIDYLDYGINISHHSARIARTISAGEYSVSGTKRYLVEKSKGLCRQMTLPSVDDALLLQCLADAFWQEIKSKAPSKNAFFEPKDHTFSKNEENEPEYGSVAAWLDFQKRILGFSKENKYVIVTDIANYYDFIDFAHLRNVIVSVATVREPIIDFLMYILSGMCWRPDYMPTREVGMPQIDMDAPRLLAHCFLFELDAVVEDMKFSNYARFMDDMDAGADNIAEAKKIIKSIDLTLQTRQLRLNSGKTKIMSAYEARRHFKVVENRFLKFFEKNIIDEDVVKASEYLPRLVWKWQRARVFDDGNGEKILKRIITFATNTKSVLDKALMHEYIRLRPNIRNSAFRYLSVVGFDYHDIQAINKIADDGHACDDAFYIEYSKALLLGRVTAGQPFRDDLDKTIEKMWGGDFYKLYSAIMLSSRFWSAGKIIEKLEQENSLWRHDPHLGRLVGGLAPIAKRDGLYRELSAMVHKSMNANALALLNFHYLVRTDAKYADPILPRFSALDSSFPCGIRYGKWMLLHGILANSGIPAKRLQKIRTTFAHLKVEPYFTIEGL